MWPFNRRPTAPDPLPRLLELENRIVLLEDRLQEQLDALKREAARVEQANRRAEQRENGLTRKELPGHTPMTSWEMARTKNLGG